ncbi:hypothetical protein Tco_1541879, partial [Tanacetum coccineum]
MGRSTRWKGTGCGVYEFGGKGLETANPFDVLNVDGDTIGDSVSQPKVSTHVDPVLDEKKKGADVPSSSNSGSGNG